MNTKRFTTLTLAAVALVAVAIRYDQQTDEASNHTTTTNVVRTAVSVAHAAEPAASLESAKKPLPARAGPQTQTTGRVPHVQIGVTPVAEIDRELRRLAFSLPGVDERPTIVSLPGASGMWLLAEVPIVRPEAIVRGREFAHIHPDGSLHAPLPIERALEIAEKGWGERHPWADQRDGWGGFVMLFTPQSMDELAIVFRLIVESYNYVTGQKVETSSFN
jgi:phospholipase/carboxylesterase